MKKLFIILAWFAASVNFTFAQGLPEKEVPQAVTASFKARYPAASDTEWKKNKSGKYEAKFKLDEKKAEAKFMADGQWDSSERRVAAKDLPEPITAYIKKNFAAYETDQIELKEESDSSKNTYEVQLKKDKTEIELVFDTAGKFLKKKDKDKNKEKKAS